MGGSGKFLFRFFTALVFLIAFKCHAQTMDHSSASSAPPLVETNNIVSVGTSAEGDAVEEVLVTGEQPGPSLLKIYKGDHVLYILGIISPLPKDMQWHSKKVENALAGAQEFIYPPAVKFDIGFWTQVSLLPSFIGIKDNPEGKTLKEIVPGDIYQHWLQLKTKYLKDDKKIEKLRPIFAADELFKQSIDKSGLAPADNIRWALEAIVKANKITITHPTITRTLENARTTVKHFKKSSLDDLACFNLTLQRLETDLDGMRLRANAWSVGDIEKLNQLTYQDHQDSCTAAILDSQLADETGLRELKDLAFIEWANAAENALSKNAVSFAFAPYKDFSDSKSFIGQLLARGYTAEY